MPLTPDEEKKFREEVRNKLEQREKAFKEEEKLREDEKRKQLEERLRARIQEEEEEKFFKERGYVKYINRHGEIEWISPEEAAQRKKSRRKKKSGSRGKHRKKIIRKLIVNIGIIVFIFIVFGILYKFNPFLPASRGSLLVVSNLPGAEIFLDGKQIHRFTPDTLKGINPGKHYVSVYKRGFSVVPAMGEVIIRENKSSLISFRLNHFASLSTVKLAVNMRGYKLYVDGMPYFVDKDGHAVLPTGYHTVMVVKRGFLCEPPFKRLKAVGDDTLIVSFDLKANEDIGYLQVSNNLLHGFVYLDKHFTGMQAIGDPIPVTSGTYEVRIRENGFISKPDSQLIHVQPGEKRMVVFRMSPIDKSQKININTRFPGAALILDGQILPGVTPLTSLSISPGNHFVNLIRESKVFSRTDQLYFIRENSNQDIYINF